MLQNFLLSYVGDALLLMGGACIGVFIMALLFVCREADNNKPFGGAR